MEKQYIISKIDLLDLLRIYFKYQALESGGVDNWDWYGESLNDFLKTENTEHIEDFDFYDIAEKELSHYKGE